MMILLFSCLTRVTNIGGAFIQPYRLMNAESGFSAAQLTLKGKGDIKIEYRTTPESFFFDQCT